MMMVQRVVVAVVACASLCVARPLEWFSNAPSQVADAHKDIPTDLAVAMDKSNAMYPPHTYQASEPTSFLQTTTGGHPLECDCERVKCNCVKRCECQLPSSAQNHVASSFLEIVGEKPGATAPLFVDIDTNECFLETGESVGQDQHHMLDCECDKVKCNCVKHCECSLPSSAAASTTEALQTGEGKTDEPATQNLLQEGEGMEKAMKKDQPQEEDAVEDAASTESFMKDAGLPEGPADAQSTKTRSRVSQVDKVDVAKKVEPATPEPAAKYNYNYNYDSEESGYAYNYNAEEKSDYYEEYSQHE